MIPLNSPEVKVAVPSVKVPHAILPLTVRSAPNSASSTTIKLVVETSWAYIVFS